MTPMKIAGVAVATVIAILAMILFVVGIPSSLVTSAIQDRVERETGYRIVVSGPTRLGLSSTFNVTAHDIAVRDPNARDSVFRVELGSAQVGLAYGSLLSGDPKVTRFVIDRPVVHVPLHRDRFRQPNAPSSKPAPSSKSDVPDHVVVKDGTLVFVHRRDGVENRIEGVNADFKMGSDRNVRITGTGRASAGPLKYELRATLPRPPLERQNIPVELTFEAPAYLQALLTAKAEMRVNNSVLLINGLTGKIGNDEFNGWASADFASKPLVKVDLDFQRLSLGTPAAHTPGPQQPWSDALIDVHGFNYLDAQIRVSAADLQYGDTVIAPAAIDASLADGVLRAQFSHLGVYGGVADGDLTIDATTALTGYTLRGDLNNVRALPLLTSLAGFDKIDGKMQAKVTVQASGINQRAIMSSLAGTVFTNFEDGAIQGLNVAKMIRSLTSGTLSGWQQSSDQTTDLAQLSASFRLESGRATNTDLALIGPLVRMTGTGIVDLPAKSLTFRVEPKLVMSTQGQGRTANPVGLGVPVMVEGPWSSPHIYPDMAGMLNDPNGAYSRLKEMGKGLFAGSAGSPDMPGGASGGSLGGLGGGLRDTLGNLLQKGLGRDSGAADSQSPPPGSGGPSPPPPSDSESMKQIFKNLFGR